VAMRRRRFVARTGFDKSYFCDNASQTRVSLIFAMQEKKEKKSKDKKKEKKDKKKVRTAEGVDR